MNLYIWDTAGQERFRTISGMYYKNAHAAIIMFSLDSEKSWYEVKTWVNELKDNVAELMIVIVGNKSDLEIIVDEDKVVQ